MTRQYSNRVTALGPIDKLAPVLKHSAAEEDASLSPQIGELAAQVLHPDYPIANTNPWNGREAHVNHFHVQFGVTKTMHWKELP
ncbi:MAG: hypothetical protein QM784_30375 [Polyangiaceae bacterium]